MKALLIKSTGEVSFVKNMEYQDLNNYVGGFLELIYFPFNGSNKIIGYVNEEGKLKQLPVNEKATKLWWSSYGGKNGDFLVGDVIITGNNGEDSIPLTTEQKFFLSMQLEKV